MCHFCILVLKRQAVPDHTAVKISKLGPARLAVLYCVLESSLPKRCEMPKKLEQIGWFFVWGQGEILHEVPLLFAARSGKRLSKPTKQLQTDFLLFPFRNVSTIVEMFQNTELMVGLALLRRVKPSGPRRFVLLSHSLTVNTSLLHFVLSPVRIILISFHSQGICSVRWSDSGHPRHALIPSLYKSSCCILLLAAWLSARGSVFEQCWKHCCGFHL